MSTRGLAQILKETAAECQAQSYWQHPSTPPTSPHCSLEWKERNRQQWIRPSETILLSLHVLFYSLFSKSRSKSRHNGGRLLIRNLLNRLSWPHSMQVLPATIAHNFRGFIPPLLLVLNNCNICYGANADSKSLLHNYLSTKAWDIAQGYYSG